VLGVQRREPAAVFVRVRDAGLHSRSDAAVLDYAAREGLIVVSHDVNIVPAHAYACIREGKPMAGLFMVQQRESVGAVIEDLVAIWALSEAVEWRDQVCFLPLR
jgi:hypothetical protein